MIINLSLLMLIALIWGAQFVFNHVALSVHTPLEVALARTAFGALTVSILCFCFVRNHQPEIKQARYYLAACIIGLFEAALPFYFIAWGQQFINSSLTAIIMGTIPIFTALFVSLFVKNEQLNQRILMSIGLGFLGLAVLFYPDIVSPFENIIGELTVLIGAISFALSLALIRYINADSPLIFARDILLFATVHLIILCLWQQGSCIAYPTPKTLSVLLALGVLCTGIAYSSYVILIKRAGAAFASMTNYLVPIVGVALGVVFVNDTLKLHQVTAIAIIFSAVVLCQFKQK